MITLAICSALFAQDPVFAASEADAYTLEYLKTPDGCVLEVGGMDFLSDGRLVVSTRRGQVWIVEDALGTDFENAKVTLFHEGLWEGLGLNVKNDEIHVIQRGEISKLLDTDGDGRCDVIETVASDWGVSGHYHEFAFGLPRDSEGNWWMGLNVSFGDPEWWHGRSTAPYRGWVTPPLYLVKKGQKKQYAWSDAERDTIVESFGGSAGIQRYKGLGEMNASQLWDTTMNPDFRTLRQVQIENGTEADRIFSMLMGDDVPPRREFIEKNAIYANIDA